MNEYSVPMALVDFLPVIIYAVAVVILQRDLYHKMGKGNYALFAAGTIMSVLAGIFKAMWKLLYAAGVCDFERLTQAFMPMQSTGFVLTGIALVAMMFTKEAKGEESSDGVRVNAFALPLLFAAAVPAVYKSSMIFIVGLVVGLLLIDLVLGIAAVRQKKILLLIFFILNFVLMCGMGYMGSSAFEAKMEGHIALKNWIEQGVNGVAQLLFLLGCIGLHKGGLRTMNLFIKNKKS